MTPLLIVGPTAASLLSNVGLKTILTARAIYRTGGLSIDALEEQKKIIEIISKGLSAKHPGFVVVPAQTVSEPLNRNAVFVFYPTDLNSEFSEHRNYQIRANLSNRDATDSLLLEVERIIKNNESTVKSFSNYEKLITKVLPWRCSVSLEREGSFFKNIRSKQKC